MQQAKYIIIQYGGIELPIIFPTLLNHYDVAVNMGTDNVVSAGFVSFGTTTDSEIVCQAYGRSVTLGKQSRKDDYKIIQQHLQLS